jgi:hypothetical protein
MQFMVLFKPTSIARGAEIVSNCCWNSQFHGLQSDAGMMRLGLFEMMMMMMKKKMMMIIIIYIFLLLLILFISVIIIVIIIIVFFSKNITIIYYNYLL